MLMATPAASACITWETLARNGKPSELDAQWRGFIAGSLRATGAFRRHLQLEDRPKLDGVNYRRYVVVAVFVDLPTSGYDIEIQRLTRRRNTLVATVHIQRPPPGAGLFFAAFAQYHVVLVSRSDLNRPIPTRVNVVVGSVSG
jgi:hypothetical protein